jgi:3-hydroxybutyrate dehydrogenase
MSNVQPSSAPPTSPSDGPLVGRTALVTGAASGIGAAVARRLAADGATVLAVDLNEEGVKALARDVPGVEPLACDLSDLDAVDALPAEVDVLVNNAGLQHVSPVH